MYGMYIEGARWDKKKSAMNHSKPKELFSSLPTIHLKPEMIMEGEEDLKNEGVYECPLYKVVSRKGTLSTTGHSTNFVMYLELPMNEKEQSVWIKHGVAAFLSLRD